MKKILVTQGHEKSIGLEVFLKSFLLLNRKNQDFFILCCYRASLEKTLLFLNHKYEISDDSIQIGSSVLKTKWLSDSNISESLSSLKYAISNLEDDDILITLPTTKGELIENNITFSGHTDYFRSKFPEHSPVMLFISENLQMALLTEHLPLSKIEEAISESLICNKIESLIHSCYGFERYIFSGINPHCGEAGLMGEADAKLSGIINRLRHKYPRYEFVGPVSGDTFLADSKAFKSKDCLISSFHDQGLAPFKALSGIRASNVTAGLPFLRLSPDHGTAFDLYGKNIANYFGMLFTLNEALGRL